MMSHAAGVRAMPTVPRFIHDCDACQYLGRFRGHDLYFCGHAAEVTQTLVLRYGDHGHEYSSFPLVVLLDHMAWAEDRQTLG